MKSAGLPPKIVNSNLQRSNHDGLNTAYDVVIAKTEKFITPRGVKGKTTVFSRISPDQLRDDKNGGLRAAATKARCFLEEKIAALKCAQDKKDRLLSLLSAQVEGNISHSSTEFFSADKVNVSAKLFEIPEAKLVRFVDASNTDIPPAPTPTKSITPKNLTS